jgi:predicted amidophosphoribosyltransferase
VAKRHPTCLCEGCRSPIDNFAERFELCADCVGEFRAIWRLYNEIVAVRAKAREFTPARLVLKLWQHFQKDAAT